MSRVYKQQELVVNISARSRVPIRADSTFFSRDIRTGKKIIRFTMDGQTFDLTDRGVKLDFMFSRKRARMILSSMDGSVVIDNPTQGICHVIMPSDIYIHDGPVNIYAYILLPDGREMDAGLIITRFEKSSLDKDVKKAQKVYIKRIEDVIRESMEKLESVDLDGILDSFRVEMAAKIEALLDGDLIDVEQIQARLLEDLQEWLEGQLDNDVIADFKAGIEERLKDLELQMAESPGSFFFVISEEQPVVEDGNHPLWLRPIKQ